MSPQSAARGAEFGTYVTGYGMPHVRPRRGNILLPSRTAATTQCRGLDCAELSQRSIGNGAEPLWAAGGKISRATGADVGLHGRCGG